MTPAERLQALMADVTYEPWPPRPRGGQIVGTGPCGVKASHPLGIEACCMSERSQHKNKIIVSEMIEWALSKYV